MTDSEFTFRPARLLELQRAIEIDEVSFQLFAEFDLVTPIADDHPFVVDEHARWRRAAERGDLCFAMLGDVPVGFSALGTCDGRAELEQLAVLPEFGRRGIGRMLIERVCAAGRARGQTELWLTTYDHVPWNRPFYERVGFMKVPEQNCGPDIRATLAAQRAVLLAPEHRVAMRRML